MPAYDSIQFEPPAPLARVTLCNLDTGAVWSEVPMLLDSGADITLSPPSCPKQQQHKVHCYWHHT